MNFIKIEKRMLKALGILLGVIGVLFIIFHFWLVNNAEKIIEELVQKESKGKLKLKVGNLKFSYFSKNMELQKLQLYTADSSTSEISYSFSINNIRLKVDEVLPIILKNQISIDSLQLVNPQIEITKLRANNDTASKEAKNISIPAELNKIYNSIQDALNALHVKKFQVDDGKLILYDKTEPGQQPLAIDNLHFRIDNLNVDSTKKNAESKFLFTDNIVLRTRNQDISFPGGIHRLAFSHFRINTREKVFEIDSCTISEIKSSKKSAGFSVFFDKLKITSADFKSLAEKNTFIADSAFCTNPVVKLTIEEKDKPADKKDLPDIARIIQRFTGNMYINYVGVTNATLQLALTNDGQKNSFNSDHNNIEIKGLQIDTAMRNPVMVKSFAMALRNQEIKLQEAGYVLSFDNILVNERRFILNNFSARKDSLEPGNEIKINSLELSGLSWPDLLFRNKIKAEEAELYNPVIVYREPVIRGRKKKNTGFYTSLNNLTEFLQVKKLQIHNGSLSTRIGNDLNLELNKLDLKIELNNFLSSMEPKDIQNAASHISFGEGKIITPGYSLQIQGAVSPDSTNNVKAKYIHYVTTNKMMDIAAFNVMLDNMYMDSITKNISLESLEWQKASITLQLGDKTKNSDAVAPGLKLNQLNLHNTSLAIHKGEMHILTNFDNVMSGQLAWETGGKFSVENLSVEGSSMQIDNKGMLVQSDKYIIADNKNSLFENFRFQQFSPFDTINAFIPRLEFVSSVSQAIEGKIKIRQAVINSPVFSYIKNATDNYSPALSNTDFPFIDIGEIIVNKPEIFISIADSIGHTKAIWKNDPGKKTNKLVLKKLVSSTDNSLTIDQIMLDANNLSYTNSKNNKFYTKDGQLTLGIKNFSISRPAEWKWAATIQNVKADDFTIDSLGKNKTNLAIKTFSLNELHLNSANYKTPGKFIHESPDFTVKDFSGDFFNNKTFLQWNNMMYSYPEKIFTIDSLIANPSSDRETFIASQKFQKEYMTLKTGRISITGFDPGIYIKDSSIKANLFSIDKATLNIYHDKRLPTKEGVIKPLPAQLIKSIPFPVSIDTLKYDSLDLIYTELNDITMQAGTVPVNRLYGIIFPVKNTGLTSIDTLNIRANGYLLDSLWMRLRIRESYDDSLAGFFVSLRMRPASLNRFNNFLPQLSSVRIKTGVLDTISMRAIGMDYLSFGEMKAYYRDLRVDFLKKNYEAKKVFLRGLVTFIARNFIIKKNNKSRTGRVFFVRNRERSIINYIFKMAMSGLASSTGAKNEKKLLRKYKRELQLRNLPPLEYD